MALVLALLYFRADTSYHAQLKRHDEQAAVRRGAESTDPNAVYFSFPFEPEPEIAEGLAFHAPALLATELPGLLCAESFTATPAWRVLKSTIIWTDWFLMIPFLGLRRPGANRPFRILRPWLRGACVFVCVFSAAAWLSGGAAHGSTPSFGIMIGLLIPIYALRPIDALAAQKLVLRIRG